ncbi:hypothetical protein LTR16_001300, partial [Cryomyces antarcticus]
MDLVDMSVEVSPWATSGGIKRRSVSVFSRRGTGTPYVTPSIVTVAKQSSAKVDARRSCRAIKKTRSGSKRPGGTVLRAVPQAAKVPAMTPLELTMATSPNEEILSAIRQPSFHFDLQAHKNEDQMIQRESCRTWTSSKQGKKERKNEIRADVIGLWRNGEVHWEPTAAQPPVNGVPEVPAVDLDVSAVVAKSSDSIVAASRTESKPKIKVVIPDTKRQAPLTFGSVLNSISQGCRSNIPSATCSMVDDSSSTAVLLSSKRDVPQSTLSPLASSSPQNLTVPNNASPIRTAQSHIVRKPVHQRSESSSSSSAEDDGVSNYSGGSSMTSVEDLTPADGRFW